MELCRKILFAIEEKYVDVMIYNLQIPEYSMEQVAYHCNILYEAGFIRACSIQCASDHIELFAVGGLTWEGHDFLDKIRHDTIWNNTKNVIVKQGLPMILDVIKQVSQSIVTSMTEGAIKAMID